jgi:large subunit ribosomal protein L21
MFAIVKIAGQQFKVKEGESLYVPHLSGKTGDKLEFTEAVLVEKDGKHSFGKDATANVKAEIVNELVKDDKVIAFKMKRRKGFRKKHGHRTQFTQIKIESIA